MSGESHRSIWNFLYGPFIDRFFQNPQARIDLDDITSNILPPNERASWNLTINGLYLNFFRDGRQIGHVSYHNSPDGNGSQSHYINTDGGYYECDVRATRRNGFLRVIGNIFRFGNHLEATENGLNELISQGAGRYKQWGGTIEINIIINDIPLNDIFRNLVIASFLIKQQYAINFFKDEEHKINPIEISFNTIDKKYFDLFTIKYSDNDDNKDNFTKKNIELFEKEILDKLKTEEDEIILEKNDIIFDNKKENLETVDEKYLRK